MNIASTTGAAPPSPSLVGLVPRAHMHHSDKFSSAVSHKQIPCGHFDSFAKYATAVTRQLFDQIRRQAYRRLEFLLAFWKPLAAGSFGVSGGRLNFGHTIFNHRL